MSAVFSRTRRIRFSDCDPAGIVFYPQYFVLFNDLMEEWMDSQPLGGFADYIIRSRCGVPTIRLEADFKAVSRMGDDVILTLNVVRIGQRSFDLALECKGVSDQRVRMSARQTLVTTSLETHQAIDIPPKLRELLTQVAPASAPRAGGLAS